MNPISSKPKIGRPRGTRRVKKTSMRFELDFLERLRKAAPKLAEQKLTQPEFIERCCGPELAKLVPDEG